MVKGTKVIPSAIKQKKGKQANSTSFTHSGKQKFAVPSSANSQPASNRDLLESIYPVRTQGPSSFSSSSSPSSTSTSLSFSIDLDSFYGLRIPLAFTAGIELATLILLSKAFLQAFGTTLDEISGDCTVDDFVNQLLSGYVIRILSKKPVITAYCAVDRNENDSESLKSIYWNPLLLFNMLRREDEAIASNQLEMVHQASLFIAAKLVHEVSHLLHYKCSPILRSLPNKRTPSKLINEQITKKDENKQEFQQQEQVLYNDFGEMLERHLFGGMIEAKFDGDDNDYMNLEHVAIYSSKAERYGHVVDCMTTIRNIRASKGEDCKFILGQRLYSRAIPSFTTCPLSDRLSHRTSRPDADVMVIEDESVSEEDEGEEEGPVTRITSGQWRT